MAANDPILIIDADNQRATRLKGMIEFLDSPRVKIATPDDWQAQTEGAALHAVFLGDGLSPELVERLCDDVEATFHGVPVVVIEREQDA
ncbi:MAG: hypothetical protein AAAFM81_12955 [Pseudomonadota bacterium]